MDTGEKKKMSVHYFRKAYEAQTHGDLGEAIELYQKSIDTFPTPEALTFLGWALSFLGKYDEAISFCKKAIDLDPDFGNPYNDIGAYFIELGKFDDAIPFLEKATKASRYDTYCFPHYNLGRVWEKKGMIIKAKQAFQRALEENPEYMLAVESLERLKYALN
ncbi:MAG: hypothetical protein A2W61_06795 [Deltaproteobacteria bacterium RIFCSPLOWO2_01_44_7]|nr:MAG: hypothetical protein A2712_00970 [Deltaproteobacteria bacterium RIFCSPHIGHO2_01_FULL_43_49]OGQ15290.1 MAG: hypothetical protein A3D22_04505 [Deltaproteobacteria bacterium RIFCSPHIGHO2_02_FULL_44_53]OGQ27086.1 MAG: hypothetical protein A3D98_01560 [Deltaproteobacteria bacterium RIFCSPHIGHO2_12_FULL_44_21]OGQ31806.1 MAG: hypothetical protein A2979_05665 [Deltaproteobacteria bacterium RIFCSPLOWO2_01_FULL_45_74]OGQ39761.1 MAG: hypothetical protein A2W61_06795 [Deltaproteobacteria bacterium 